MGNDKFKKYFYNNEIRGHNSKSYISDLNICTVTVVPHLLIHATHVSRGPTVCQALVLALRAKLLALIKLFTNYFLRR